VAWIGLFLSFLLWLDYALPKKGEEQTLKSNRSYISYVKRGKEVRGYTTVAHTDKNVFYMPYDFQRLQEGTKLWVQKSTLFQIPLQIKTLDADWQEIPDHLHTTKPFYISIFFISLCVLWLVSLNIKKIEWLMTLGFICLVDLFAVCVLFAANHVI
jgi:hypothetical protein